MSSGAFDLQRLNPARARISTLMLGVMAALLPGTLIQITLLGVGTLVNLLVAIAGALIVEALVLRLRHRPLTPALTDGSIVLAAWLLALSLPPSLPLWQVLIGAIAMATLGKHLYGGLGCNPFNPAMVGYAVLVVSFPITMTAWPGHADTADVVLEKRVASTSTWDGMTSATPLDRWRAETRLSMNADTAADAGTDALNSTHLILQSPWPWINGAFLLGGLWMLWRGVISWRIPVSVLLSLGSLHLAYGWLGNTPQPAAFAELLAGAAILGAFFIATDPVTAPSSPRARLIYGTGIGALIFVLREFSAWPEGVAFAVLLMNCTVPLLDRLSLPVGRTRS